MKKKHVASNEIRANKEQVLACTRRAGFIHQAPKVVYGHPELFILIVLLDKRERSKSHNEFIWGSYLEMFNFFWSADHIGLLWHIGGCAPEGSGCGQDKNKV